jgi:hypothetical protein
MVTSATATTLSASDRPLAVIGHPGHKRVKLFQEALQRRGWPPAAVIAYQDVLEGPATWAQSLPPRSLVRLESPGQHFEVERLLIVAGAEVPDRECPHACSIDAVNAQRLAYDKGRLWYPRQRWRGLRAVLGRLSDDLASVPGARWLTPPADVARMFDKPRCQREFAAAGLPVPRRLDGIRSFDELREALRSWPRRRVFVKLAHGSSASGTVALALERNRVRAYSTVEMVEERGVLRLYNSRRLQEYQELGRVARLIDWLCREGVHVEEWLPKESLGGPVFDLRVLVVRGEICHVVVRTSRGPMTNLHLLNQRGDVDAAQATVGRQRWHEALESCRRAAALFPDAWHCGVDVMFVARSRGHAILEINAFGDLLPGALWNGRDTYDAEIEALEATTPCTT